MKKHVVANIIYFGHDINTLLVLSNEKYLKVKGVAKIKDFIKYNTYNPINKLFKIIYLFHLRGQQSFLKKLLLWAFQYLTPMSTGLFKKYSLYLQTIVNNDIKILDINNISTLQNYVNEQEIVLFVVHSWGILPKEIIEMPTFGCLNIHPSRLPKYRGALPTLWALKNHDKTAAVTYMVLDLTMDGGKIMAQHEFEILPADTALTINQKIEDIVSLTLSKDILSYLKGQTKLLDQSITDSTKTAKFYAYRIIDFSLERARDVSNKINLYAYQYPTSKCYALSLGRKVTFLGSQGIEPLQTLLPGRYEIDGFILTIGCKDQAIKLRLFKDVNLINSCLFYLKIIDF